jgi:hypothetical protein
MAVQSWLCNLGCAIVGAKSPAKHLQIERFGKTIERFGRHRQTSRESARPPVHQPAHHAASPSSTVTALIRPFAGSARPSVGPAPCVYSPSRRLCIRGSAVQPSTQPDQSAVCRAVRLQTGPSTVRALYLSIPRHPTAKSSALCKPPGHHGGMSPTRLARLCEFLVNFPSKPGSLTALNLLYRSCGFPVNSCVNFV